MNDEAAEKHREIQEDFVHACVAVDEAQPVQTNVAIRERAIGALLGLAVGDALGTTLEFSARDSRPRVTAMEGGGPFRLEPGDWTDDTSMALALADSLLCCDGLDEHDLMTRFMSWMEEGHTHRTGAASMLALRSEERSTASGRRVTRSPDRPSL